jgi:uncharacterized protein YndB with AHSA1/START domain
MLRFIGGCLVVVLVVAIAAFWFGYRKLETYTAEGASVTVTIAAPPPRVFASLADADSMTEWRLEGLGLRASRRGLLKQGDTLHAQMRSSGGRQERATWIVTAVVPNKLFATQMLDDSGRVLATRRDSLVEVADSTKVVTTFATPRFDSIRVAPGNSTGVAGGRALDMASKLVLSGLKLQSTSELDRLKARLERGVARSDTSAPSPPAKQPARKRP